MGAHARPGVLVVGAGVSGLTTALALRDAGFEVTVLAESFAPGITSNVAGALWEWPPAVCGQHRDPTSLARAKEWCVVSYRRFAELAADPDTGVFVRRANFYFRRPVAGDGPEARKMNELKERVAGFVHDPGLIAANGVDPGAGLRDAYAHLAPMVDTDVYMRWLFARVEAAGCRVLRGRLAGTLREQEAGLLERFRAGAVVNCAGLGARELADEPVFPLRGALVRVRNDGRQFPRIEQAHCVAHDESAAAQGMVFIVPRGRDTLVLGGLVEPHQWGTDIGLADYEPVRAMYRRCVEFLPALRDAELDPAEPVRVGLRPFRAGNVRLEREGGTRVVHNYGHGGSGVTLSWGCAAEATELVRGLLAARE